MAQQQINIISGRVVNKQLRYRHQQHHFFPELSLTFIELKILQK
jgi:hypothetical protein